MVRPAEMHSDLLQIDAKYPRPRKRVQTGFRDLTSKAARIINPVQPRVFAKGNSENETATITLCSPGTNPSEVLFQSFTLPTQTPFFPIYLPMLGSSNVLVFTIFEHTQKE
ncbi:MAG TPA: hypothetical protein VJC10_01580 [Patescibacteria group bacterium]|nr:hypothetical protein [Patescibacteria group bacterium]